MEIIFLAMLPAVLGLVAVEILAIVRLLPERRRDPEPPRPGERTESEERRERELERAFQEGMNSMMGYDLAAARRAVRDDGREEE